MKHAAASWKVGVKDTAWGCSVCASCCVVLLQVLLLLKDVLNPSVRLYLNPQTELSELPLKSFYR